MSILDLPVLSRKTATTCTFSLVANTQTFESPLTKTVQTYELPGARWMFTATWSNLDEVDARILKSWILKLRGQAGRFYANDLSHKTVSGSARNYGNGAVYGAGQVGNSLETVWGGISLTADSTVFTADSTVFTADHDSNGNAADGAWLLPGDYVGIAGELKQIVDVIPIEAETALATIIFEPAMRTGPADAEVVNITNPKAVFRLKDDNQDSFEFNFDRRPSVTISGVEVFQ